MPKYFIINHLFLPLVVKCNIQLIKHTEKKRWNDKETSKCDAYKILRVFSIDKLSVNHTSIGLFKSSSHLKSIEMIRLIFSIILRYYRLFGEGVAEDYKSHKT